MAGLFVNGNYVQNSIITSRIVQEETNTISGVSEYGVLASLIDRNIEKIDGIAEYIGQYIAQKSNYEMYVRQYGEPSITTYIKRDWLQMTQQEVVGANETARRNKAFFVSLLVETGIKYSARCLENWASERDKYQFFEKVYQLLNSFVFDHEMGAGNCRRAQLELKKICNAFPLNEGSKNRLIKSNTDSDLLHIDTNFWSASGNSQMRDIVAYFLYAIFAQKFEEREDAEKILLDYYSILGYSGALAKEILRENGNKYNHIACDQTKYLKIARGMVKNFDACLPTIDINALNQRAEQMSQFDPYFLPKMHSNSVSPVKKRKRISDIFFEDPQTIVYAGITALAQLELDDNSKENIRKKFVDWGVDGNTSDVIVEQADVIRENVYES